MRVFVQEKISETHGLHGATHGVISGAVAADAFDLGSSFQTASAPSGDAESAEMVRKFDEILAALKPARDEFSRDEQFRVEPSNHQAEAGRLARSTPLRAAEDASGKREGAAPRATQRPTMILAIGVALAVGAAAGVLATTMIAPSAASAKIDRVGRAYPGPRLDYKLMLPPAVVEGDKP